MRRIATTWVLTLVLAALFAGAVTGYELRPASAAPSPASGSPALSITAAGTLSTAFGQVGDVVVNNTPGAQNPAAAQTYLGSIAALELLLPPVSGSFDVAASADFRLIPQILEPTYTTWEMVFATNPEVLCYDPSVPALAGLNGTNWPAKVEQPGLLMGVANASVDPNGYNEIFVLQLEDLLLSGSLPSLYGHFYAGAVGALAVANPSDTRVEPENAAASLLASHTVQLFITYRSYAVANHLSYVPLDPRAGLGALDPADLAYYAQASTTILAAGGTTETLLGAPVLYSVTVPDSAPNATLGAIFATTLVSPSGAAILSADGFTPILPAYLQGSSVPPLLAPQGVPLPTSLAGLLS